MGAKKRSADDDVAPSHAKMQSSPTRMMQQMGGRFSIFDQARNYAYDAYTDFVKKHADNEKHRHELNKLQNQLNNLRDPAAKNVEFAITPPPPMVPITGNKNIEELRSIANKYRHATNLLGNDALHINSQIKETHHAIREAMKTNTAPDESAPKPGSHK